MINQHHRYAHDFSARFLVETEAFARKARGSLLSSVVSIKDCALSQLLGCGFALDKSRHTGDVWTLQRCTGGFDSVTDARPLTEGEHVPRISMLLGGR